MKIAYNPKTGAALTTAPANNDITFDLKGLNIFVRGEKFKGTDTTYSVFKKHTSASGGGYNGLVPVPSYTTTNIRFLREDGTWKSIDSYQYTQITNQDLNTLKTEGKWYYAAGGNTTTNKPSGVDAYELYVGRNANGYRYQKLITSDGIIWFRYHNASTWTSWVRWYTDANTDYRVKQSASTTTNFRPLILGYNNSTDKSVLANDITNQVYTTTTIYAQSSSGTLYANKFIGKIDWSNIDGKPSCFTPCAHTHSSNQITTLTSYVKATSNSALSTSDSLNIALGKLEYKGDLGITAYNLVNAAYDGDGTIENLKEILKVLEGIKDTETIKGLLGKYLPLAGGTMTLGEGLKFHSDGNYFGTNLDARIISLLDDNATVCNGGLIIDERCTYNGTTTITELLRIRDAEFKWKGQNILHSGNSNIQNGVITINGVSITPLTAHQSLANYVTLNTEQTITGIKTFTKQQKFTVANGTAPFQVTSKTKVTNLNVDYIEGYNINNIVRVINDNAIDVNTIQYPCIIRLGTKNSNIPSNCNYGNLLNVKMYSADTAFQLLGSYHSDLLYFRTGTLYADGTGSINTNKWRQIAFIDSDITGNAATASKLGTSTIGAINVPIYLNEGTPTVVNLNSTANNLINSLSIGTSIPVDNDYYISQYVNGGTAETSYHRRPHSALYSYIKSKAEGTWNISITGNAATATKLTTSAGSAALPIYFSDGKPIACTASSIFSNLLNDGNNISITVAGQNRTLTVGYATLAVSLKHTTLTSNQDLNTLTTEGVYSNTKTVICKSLVNGPTNRTNGECRLEVINCGSYQYSLQWLYTKASTKGEIWYRMGGQNSKWSPWSKIAFTSDIPTSLPASDVYDWAKQPTKPSYSFSEINQGVATIGDGTNRLMFRTSADWSSGMYHSTPGNESMVFANINPVTSWIFANTNPTANTDWTTLTPSLQIKNGRVTINKLISSGTDAPYNLDVNGSANATILYENGVRVSVSGHTHNYLPLSGGTLTGDLTLSLGDFDRFIVFSYPGTVNPDSNSWRTGVLGSGNGEANYYVVQYQRVNTSSSTWNTAFKIGQDTGTVMFTNNITIGDKVNYHSGNLAPQTLTLSTSPQTYITANGTNYILKLPNSDPYTSARTPTAHTHPYLPLAGGTMNQGSHVIFPGTSTDASYGGSIEFREVDYVNTTQTDWLYAPGITFHWGGRSVGKLGLRSDGDLAWRDQSIIHSGNINSQSVNYANSANKLNKWFNSRIEDLNQQFGDGALRIFNSTSSTTANKCPSDSSILHLAWDNNNGYDSQLALDAKGNNIYFRGQNGGTWSPWKTVLHNGNSSISGNTITINGSSITVSKSDHTHSYLPLTGGTLTGSLTVGNKDANEIISIAGNTSHLKMIAHTNATYIESGNKDWDGNTPLLITGYSGNKGSNLYLYFDNIYCRSSGNSYVNLDSGNWSNYITIPTLTSQLTNDSGFLTSRGYIGRTTVQATAAAQSLTGICNITPETANTYYLGASDKPWYQIFGKYFTSGPISLYSSQNANTGVKTGYLSYASTNGYFYITANNIAAGTSGGFVMKTIKNGIVSQILLESASDYGQIRTTGDLYIGGRVSNTTALISSDAAHNMYISVQGKILLVCDSNENSIRRGKNQVDNITLGTGSCPWESLYVKNGVKLKGKTNYFSIQAPNGTHSSDEIFSLPYTGGTLVTTNSPAMVKGWATYSFSYTNGTSSTYTMTFKAGGGVNIVDSPSYYEYYKGPGILIRIDNNCKDTSEGTIKDSLMIWGQAGDTTQSLYITKTTVQLSGGTVHYYLVYCKNTSGTALTSGSGTLNFIYF